MGNIIHDTSTATDTLIKDWVNSVYHQISQAADLRPALKKTSFSTVNAQANYTLASDVGHLTEMWQTTTPIKLQEISLRDFDETFPNPTASGNPQYYMIEEPASSTFQVQLYPIPGSVITINYRYYAFEADLSADTDVPILPANFHWLLVRATLVQALEWQNAFSDADLIWEREVVPGIAKLIKYIRNKPDYLPRMKSLDTQARRFLPFPAGYPSAG